MHLLRVVYWLLHWLRRLSDDESTTLWTAVALRVVGVHPHLNTLEAEDVSTIRQVGSAMGGGVGLVA